jgi:hypothetical protein
MHVKSRKEKTSTAPARSWTGGPLRKPGYLASYVCDVCDKGVPGVYRITEGIWLCGTCKNKPQPDAGPSLRTPVLSDNQPKALAGGIERS